MEVAHSLSLSQIEALVSILLPVSRAIADLPSIPDSQARLVKPMLSFDSAAFALSFVPAAGEALHSSSPHSRTRSDDNFTYHHLRRTLHELITAAGVSIASRYIVPSAHLTIARFNSPNPFDVSNPLDVVAGRDPHKRETLMQEVETINAWLESEFWPKMMGTKKDVTDSVNIIERTEAATESEEGWDRNAAVKEVIKPGGEWTVGEESGLDFRKGTLWYGGGETIYLGRGIGQGNSE